MTNERGITIESINGLCPEAQAAGKWWKEQLKSPIFNNGDNSIQGVLLSGFAMVTASEISEDVLNVIELKIGKRVHEFINSDESRYLRLSADYGAEGVLEEILEPFGHEVLRNVPWKTIMDITKGSVEVAHNGSRTSIYKLGDE